MVHLNHPGEALCLHVSELAPDVDFVDVQQIIQLSRRRHTELSIRGALVFDGERIGQLLVGPQAAVAEAMGRIEQEPHYRQMRRLHAGTSASTWATLTQWSSGYCGTADLDAVMACADGDAAVQTFLRLVANAVMD